MNIDIKKLEKSEIEINGELPADKFEEYYKQALENLSANLEIPGFRKGKAPEDVVLKHIPENTVLSEMAELAMRDAYPKILEENKLDAIGRPDIMITKIARKNPLGFKIKTATIPAVILPDYKKIAKETKSKIPTKELETEVTEKEVEDTILNIRKSRTPQKESKEEEESKKEEIKEEDLVPLTDEFVKTLGEFKDVEDFKVKLKENIAVEKKNIAQEKTRLKIIEAIMEKTKADIPDILVDAEAEKILYRMKSDISNMGMKFEDYLTHIKKSEEDLKKDFRKDGEKKAKLSLTLHEIAKTEDIKADKAQVAKEVEMIMAHYKDADKSRAEMHAEQVLTNEAIFKFLETQ